MELVKNVERESGGNFVKGKAEEYGDMDSKEFRLFGATVEYYNFTAPYTLLLSQ